MQFTSIVILIFCLGFLPGNEATYHSWSTPLSTRKTIYTFLMTEDVLPGQPFGRIESPERHCKATFKCLSRRRTYSVISVDRNKGTLTLRKSSNLLPKRYNGIRMLDPPTKIKITSLCGHKYRYYGNKRKYFYVTIKIFVFPSKFGDRFLNKYDSRALNRMVTTNKLEMNAKERSSQLHRMMRMVSKNENPEALEEMMASVRVKTALEKAINDILATYIPKIQGQQIVFFWSRNLLFSNGALNRLAVKSGCKKDKFPKCPRIRPVYRTIDGTCNNIKNPLFGAAPTALTRLVPAKYFDREGLNDPIGFPGQSNVPDIPATFKVVRDFIEEQVKAERLNTKFSHALMQFGQFLDHDLDLSPEIENSERCMNTRCDGSKEDFAVPCYTILPLKPRFHCIHFSRSATECQIKNGRIVKRQQINVNTAYIDASQIYGSTAMVAKELRDLKSRRGLLKTSQSKNGDLLPRDNNELVGLESFCLDRGGCFLAGDGRSNEQMVLASMHTLFLREHNRIAKTLKNLNRHWNGEKIYQETRKIVGAVLQKITYEDFLPIIIGPDALPEYKYDPSINPGILNSFATAAFRFGHSLIRPAFDILDKGFNPTGNPLPLRQLFFNNTFIRSRGIDELLLGLLGNESQVVDRKLAAGLLNNLFERLPESSGLNLAALNIQRGRDHGLPGYNAYRKVCGLKDASRSFHYTKNEIQYHNRLKLFKLYNNDPNIADLWVAGLAETPVRGALVGRTFRCIIREQMRRVRDGDRFFYENPQVFTSGQLEQIKKASLSKVLCDNLNNIVSVQENAFLAGSARQRRISCCGIPGIDLHKWKDNSIKY